MPSNPLYEKKLKEMSDAELFEEMDSAASVVNGISQANREKGIASRPQFRYNTVAKEILKRELWVKYNEGRID